MMRFLASLRQFFADLVEHATAPACTHCGGPVRDIEINYTPVPCCKSLRAPTRRTP